MKYFYDFEFEDNGHYIIPISLGIVAEDNRELYLVNRQYMETWLFEEPYYWQGQYASEPNKFVGQYVVRQIILDENMYGYEDWIFVEDWPVLVRDFISCNGRYESREQIELWGYYSAYDHVCLAQLFGPMDKLPEPVPMFTHEIMQLKHDQSLPVRDLTKLPEHNALADAKYQKLIYESWI